MERSFAWIADPDSADEPAPLILVCPTCYEESGMPTVIDAARLGINTDPLDACHYCGRSQ